MFDYNRIVSGESSLIPVFLLVNSHPLKFDISGDLIVTPVLMLQSPKYNYTFLKCSIALHKSKIGNWHLPHTSLLAN